MLKTTGFVLPDVGIYTLTALADKDDPAQVTMEDLDAAADYLERFYSQGVGKSLASTIFPNSGFMQATFDKPQFIYKRAAWADLVLRGHRPERLEAALVALEKPEYREMVLRGDANAPRCVFSGQPAYLRVSRDMLPMLNGRGIINFGPMGEAGLPVSAEILLAIHAMPLGCVITQGALLAVESDDPELMAAFARMNLERNRRFSNLAAQNDYDKFPNLSFYKTRLVDVLVEALTRQREARGDSLRVPSLNAYHFSNYGTNARITIYTLPSSTVQFVWEATKDRYAAVWRRIVAESRIEEKSEAEELEQQAPKLTQRSLIYEDLFDLPQNAAEFLRTYFLRKPLSRFKQDPRAQYSPFREADLLSWDLTALFLKRIMNMEKSRIEHIKTLGDRLAAYIQERDDRRLLKALYFERQYSGFRGALLRAMKDYTGGGEPLVSFDGFVKIFEEGEEFEKPDWNLARDLLMIRIFEQLHRQGYWTTVAETLQTEESDEALAAP